MRVFLGGTTGESDWREKVIPKLTIDYFNPIVDDWTKDCREVENQEKKRCTILLFVITPFMKGVYSVAEAIQASNRAPHKTVFCVLDEYEGKVFNEGEKRSLEAVKNIVRENGALVLDSLEEVIKIVNNFKKLDSIDMSKYHPVFLDTEFTNLAQDCQLISIGITDMNDNTFYAESNQFDEDKCSEWVKEHILPTLKFNNIDTFIKEPKDKYSCKGSDAQIRKSLMDWFRNISGGKQILVVSDCLAYDWVLFAELVKDFNMEFPSDEIFYVPVDIMGILIARGLDIDIKREDLVNMSSESKHNALHDAEVIKEIWKKYL